VQRFHEGDPARLKGVARGSAGPIRCNGWLPPAPPGTPLLLGRLLPIVAGRFTGEGSRTRGKPGISVEERNPTVHTHAPGVGAKWQCANVGRALVCVAKWIGPVTWQRLTA